MVDKNNFPTPPNMFDQKKQLKQEAQCKTFSKTAVENEEKKVTTF